MNFCNNNRVALLGLASALTLVPVVLAGVNVSTGVTVPSLNALDQAMINYMNANGVEGGALAVSNNGCIVYQRGFGWDILPNIPIPENMPMRLASVEKPLAAAVIQDMIANNEIAASDLIFDINGSGGLLPGNMYYPYDGLGDARLADITVMDLLQHRGGFGICQMTLGDPQFAVLEIADELGVASPPGRANMVRYMMSQPLAYTPGTMTCSDAPGNCGDTPSCASGGCYCGVSYSNFGYMLLGLVVEHATGFRVDYNVRSRLLTPDLWVPETEVYRGLGPYNQVAQREPTYLDDQTVTNVYDPGGDDVTRPYGGWDHYAFQGHGNMVASAAPLLKFLDTYIVVGANIGALRGTLSGGAGWSMHTGGMAGTSTAALQRGDGINIVVLMSTRPDDDDAGDAASQVDTAINVLLADPTFTWPTWCLDGFWVNFNQSASGYGGFSDPFVDMNAMVNSCTDGSKVHFQVGSTSWTGTVSTKMLWDAPWGTVTIGE
jgi:CubicO group peptidase (beta-lactamase class C family)